MYDSQKLKEILEWQGRTQSWMAERTGKSEATISRYFGGQVPMPPTFAAQAANLLGVPIRMFEADKAQPVEAGD